MPSSVPRRAPLDAPFGHFAAVGRLAAVVFLAGLTVVRCECENTPVFKPSASYTPASKVLDFGVVSIAGEKTLFIKVASTGSAPLKVVSAALKASSDKFLIHAVPPDILAPEGRGLGLGKTSSIAVTYRPCPAAWDGNLLKANFSFDETRCPSIPDSAQAVLTDNSDGGATRIELAGRPGQRPTITVACAPGGGVCGADPNLAEIDGCAGGLDFGNVSSAGDPCELIIEIRNQKVVRGQTLVETGDLLIERIEVLAKELDRGVLAAGPQIGFSVLDATGAPLVLDADHPLKVAIPSGAVQGSARLKLRFNGSGPGIWRGQKDQQSGIRFFSNDPDPDHAPFVVSVSAIGTTPDIATDPEPAHVDFGQVAEGLTAHASLKLRNRGNADLIISAITFVGANSPFEVANPLAVSPRFLGPSGSGSDILALDLGFKPHSAALASDTLRIESNDPDTPNLTVPVSGGAVPHIQVTPETELVFELPHPLTPPPLPARTETLTIQNTGYGALVLGQIELRGPGDGGSTSIDDFSIAECQGNPCELNQTLCSPGTLGCQSSSLQLHITYANNDISATDLVNLKIRSNDPDDAEHTLILSAKDVPCFYPTANITVTTSSPLINRPVMVDGSASEGAGSAGITTYRWRWFFTPQPAPAIIPNGPRATFTPSAPGTYILGLDVVNDCGAMSQETKRESISIDP